VDLQFATEETAETRVLSPGEVEGSARSGSEEDEGEESAEEVSG